MTDKTSEKLLLTTRESEFIICAFQCLKDPGALQIDYTKAAGLAGLQNPKSASNMWSNIKKKLMPAASPSGDPIVNGDNTNMTSPTNGAHPKAKAQAKKRAPAKPKAKAKASTDADAEAEADDGDNGVVADDEQTPANTPKAKGGAKRKAPEPSSPIKLEDQMDDAAHGGDIVEEAPAKKKRTYTRKPRDPNAPPPKPRNKKGANAPVASVPVVTEDTNMDDANAQLLTDAEAELEEGGERESMFGDGNIKIEGPDELTPEEQYMTEQALAV